MATKIAPVVKVSVNVAFIENGNRCLQSVRSFIAFAARALPPPVVPIAEKLASSLDISSSNGQNDQDE